METQTSTYTIEVAMPALHGSHGDAETIKRMFDVLERQRKPVKRVKLVKRTMKKKAKK